MILLSSPSEPVRPTTSTADDHFVMFHTAKMDELVGSAACPHCNTAALHVTETDIKGYAVQLHLTCEHCYTELSSVYSSPKLPTCDNPTRQPYIINHLAVLAAREGGINQTGLVRLTPLMNVKGGIHHKTFSRISTPLGRRCSGRQWMP